MARFGLVNLAMLRARGIEGTVLAGVFAILPERLAAAGPRATVREFSLFPAALRDIALVVDASATRGDVRAALARIAAAAAGSAFAVEGVEVFDVYEGKGLPEGKKSLALSLVFRSPTRTLTDDEVNGVLRRSRTKVAATTPYQLQHVDAMPKPNDLKLDHVAEPRAHRADARGEGALRARSSATCSPTSRS